MTPEQREATLAYLEERKTAYSLAFCSKAGQAVLEDLAKFCRADTTCFDPDARIHAALEGRREVYLRIRQHIDLTSEQLLILFNRPNAIRQENTNG